MMDWKWVNYCALGELLGFTAAAGMNILHLQLIGEPSSIAAIIIILLFATIGGILEGSILAWFQWVRLKDYIPQLDLSSWRLYTAFIAAAGWFLGMLFPTIMSFQLENTSSDVPVEPPLWLIALGGLLMGIVLGLLFGYFQSIPLRAHTTNPNSWITANILGWGLAMIVLMVGPSIIPAQTPVIWIIIIAMGCGLIAGGIIGLVTMYFVDRLDTKSI